MRAFIAIELSEPIRNALSQIESHLKYSGADVKWVKEENIHLTLKFLGEAAEDKIEEIKSILDEIARGTKPFKITIKDIGAFPRIECPRVIWVGLDKGANEAQILAEVIDAALSKIGYQRETRPFASHLTIGRVRSPKNKDALKEKLATYHLSPMTHDLITSITLFQSALRPEGPIYKKLYEARLSG